ncbi:uncharacterized aarF domain-containing protein kinase 5 [Euwallacea similis]|uniref:uncharacterized aarF domain-containing protein kinase 5 n=1 Tax=Euwallacea similis TaxID=1736056 RepID=UPI00344E2261
MTSIRWPICLLRKYLTSSTKNKHRKYLFTGVTTGLAAVTIGNVSRDDQIVMGSRGILRFIRTMRIGLTISLDYYFSMLGLSEGSPNYEFMMSRIHQRSAERIRDGCLYNGGTYIKLGQGLVSMSHILPKEYIQTLKVLQDKCLSREKEELYQVFQQDFGMKPEELFETFDATPLAAASIAQVFLATTKEGQKVAVKVQYKDLQKRLDSDVMMINIHLAIGAWLHPKVDFTWILNDFVEALKQELDFVNEGHNGERCARELAHLKYVYVPKIFWKYTNTRVLVTEFVEGIKISDVQKLKENGFSLADINNKLFEAFGHQIFQTGFVHADPHPGNVLIRRRNGRSEIIILDHGLYQKISKEQRTALSHLWKAIVFRDHNNMKTYSKALGVDDYAMFAEILTQAPLRSTGFKLKAALTKQEEEVMRKLAGERFDQIVECLQQMPRSLLLVIRNLNTIRAISYDHGCPIDRYSVLARMATKAAFESEDKKVLKRKIIVFLKRLWFEINLLIAKMLIYWRTLLLRILCITGLAPDMNAFIENTARKL